MRSILFYTEVTKDALKAMTHEVVFFLILIAVTGLGYYFLYAADFFPARWQDRWWFVWGRDIIYFSALYLVGYWFFEWTLPSVS